MYFQGHFRVYFHYKVASPQCIWLSVSNCHGNRKKQNPKSGHRARKYGRFAFLLITSWSFFIRLTNENRFLHKQVCQTWNILRWQSQQSASLPGTKHQELIAHLPLLVRLILGGTPAEVFTFPGLWMLLWVDRSACFLYLRPETTLTVFVRDDSLLPVYRRSVVLLCATTDMLIRPTDECCNNGCDDLLITTCVDRPIMALLAFCDN